MRDHLQTKRAMRRLATTRPALKKDDELQAYVRRLVMNDAWGTPAREVAWRVSAFQKVNVDRDIPHSRGCTQMLTLSLVREMAPAVALRYLIEFYYAHRAATRYSYPDHNGERMKVPRIGVPPWTDCSGMIRCQWWQAGWPDPAGAAYAVSGNSESFIAQTRRVGAFVRPGQERLGDIVCFRGGVGHAQLVTKRGVCLSNGQDAGPLYVPAFAHSGEVFVCRLPPFV